MARRRWEAVVGGLGLGIAAVLGAGGGPAMAEPVQPGPITVVVSPHGNDHNPGGPKSPLRSLAAAQAMARVAEGAGRDVRVELTSGMFTLNKPLRFTAADSGRPGHPITWTAAPGAKPVISGGGTVAGWKPFDASKGIFVASVPKGQDSRQLYKNNLEAPRAAITISRSDVSVTPNGMQIVNHALDYLATLPQQNRIEVESEDSFTDRYALVQSISGSTVTMQQPGWQNNNWGYDTLAHPFAGGQLRLENSYSFLQPGQWYLDPTAGKLYYRATSGENPNADSFVLPHMQSLVQVAGSYAKPVHDLSFSGIQFSYSTWLSPSTSIGYADQQNGAFIPKAYPQPEDYLSSCQSGCSLFRRRP